MKYTIIIWLILLTSCSNTSASKPYNNEDSKYNLLLSSLLNINQNKYTYIDANGKKQPDSLKKFKELEKIYINNIKPDLDNNKFSNKQLKIIMFYSFYSYEKKSAAFQEYLSADLMPIYNQNKDSFLAVLKELPFLIPSNCDRLNSFFGFEGKNIGKKPKFVKQNNEIFKKYLNPEQFKSCINHFNNSAR